MEAQGTLNIQSKQKEEEKRKMMGMSPHLSSSYAEDP